MGKQTKDVKTKQHLNNVKLDFIPYCKQGKVVLV